MMMMCRRVKCNQTVAIFILQFPSLLLYFSYTDLILCWRKYFDSIFASEIDFSLRAFFTLKNFTEKKNFRFPFLISKNLFIFAWICESKRVFGKCFTSIMWSTFLKLNNIRINIECKRINLEIMNNSLLGLLLLLGILNDMEWDCGNCWYCMILLIKKKVNC